MCMACQPLSEDDMRYLAKLAAEAKPKADAQKNAQAVSGESTPAREVPAVTSR